MVLQPPSICEIIPALPIRARRVAAMRLSMPLSRPVPVVGAAVIAPDQPLHRAADGRLVCRQHGASRSMQPESSMGDFMRHFIGRRG